MRTTPFVLSLCVLVLAACTHKPAGALIQQSVPAVLVPASKAAIADGRGRFREIYAAVQNDHGAALPFDRSPDQALWRLAGEPAPTGRPVDLADSRGNLRVVLVPGFLAECAAQWTSAFEDARANMEKRGYLTDYVQTGGRHSCERNAQVLRQALLAMPAGQRIILVTHSKGTPDCLTALALYPELADRVAALVSVAGATAGSPLADNLPLTLQDIVSQAKLFGCDRREGPNEALASLSRSARLAWLASHAPPKGVRLYSLAAVAEPENMSRILRPFYNILAETDPLNDGMVLAADSLIPGSTLLGYANADHLAVAMPMTGPKSPPFSHALNNRNDYPRAVLLEAAVRFVEEDLAGAGAQ